MARPRAIGSIAVLCALLVRTPEPTAPELMLGPLLGAVSEHSVKVWARLSRAGSFRVRYWPKDAPRSVHYASSASATLGGDYTATAVLDGLLPSTRYEYRLERAFDSAWYESAPRARQQFHTLRPPGQPGKLRFVVSADIADHNSSILTTVRKVAPDFVLLLGDNIYRRKAISLEAYRQRYRMAWGAPRMAELFAEVPSFMIWDDHEIRDNFWPGRAYYYPQARQAYLEYQHSHNPEPLARGELYYVVVAGDVEIFMLDERSHRDPNDARDGPHKSMLGAAQKHALLAWLENSPARLKVIASPVIFSRYATTGNDAWNGFAHERREIFDRITALRLPSVLIVSGDQHWNALLRVEHEYHGLRQAFYELQATPLAAERNHVPTLESPEFIARDDDQNAFGVVDVDTTVTPMRVALTVCGGRKRCRAGREKPPSSPLQLRGARETVPYTVVLSGNDLGPLPPPEQPAAPDVIGN